VSSSASPSRETSSSTLAFCNDYGRRRRDPGADHPQDPRGLFEVALDDRRHPKRGVEHRAGLLVDDDVEAGEEADAAHVADQRMVGERAERVLHMRADAPDMAEKVHLLVDARHLERDGRAATGCAQ